MTRINLLPWRAERRNKRRKEFFGMLLGAALASVLLSFVAIKYHSSMIEAQQADNAYLESEIKTLEAQIAEIATLEQQREELLARKQVIEQLQSNRSQMVHLFDQLVRTIPDGVKLASIKQTGNELTLEGVAQSNARVSSYLRQLEASEWMKGTDLSVIEAKGENPAMPYQFSLRVNLTSPGAAEAAEQAFDDAEVVGGGV